MAKTGIEWTEATWNPIVGCSIVSPGCTNCYAMTMAGRLETMGTLPHYGGTTKKTKAGPVWTGKLALAPEASLLAPLRRRKPTVYFVNSMGDLFHEDAPDAWIDRVFAVMALTPQHTYQVLTKRSARMRAYMDQASGRIADGTIALRKHPLAIARGVGPSAVVPVPHLRPGAQWWPLANVWLGVSAEDQRRADERIPDLLATPAAIRFVSAEPLLGSIDFQRIAMPKIRYETGIHYQDVLRAGSWSPKPFFRPAQPSEEQKFFTNHSDTERLNWIIAGGESGPNARPMHPDWARAIRDQCAAAGTAFFFKQWGAWAPLQAAPKIEEAEGRTCSVAWPDGTIGPGSASEHGGPGTVLYVATKKIAARLLDGATHDGMPEVAHG